MLSFRDSGQAILFVSHNLSAVEMMCDRTIWLDHGVIREIGPTAEVVRAYLDAVDDALVDAVEPALAGEEESDLALEEATIEGSDGEPRTEFDYGEAMAVKLRWRARRDVRRVQISVTVRGDYGPLFTATSERFDFWRAGPHELTCAFEMLPLLPGVYRVETRIDNTPPSVVGAFRVVTDLASFGSTSVVGATKSRGGFLAVAYDWRVQSGAGDQRLSGLRLPSIARTPRDARS
jgi:hypothetical protein